MERADGPSDETGSLSFRFADPEHRLAGVRLQQWAGIPGDRLDFAYADGEWVLDVPRPPAHRLEYLFELRHQDGGTESVCDPRNPRRVSGAFGDKSVAECPGYTAPDWLNWDGVLEESREFTVAAPALHAEVSGQIWSPVAAANRVVVVHDGPEYDRLASLTQYSAAMIEAGHLPPHHLVLLSPGDRNEWYSANPAYARTLTTTVLPRVHAELGTSGPVVGLGASLGALAMLHAHRRHPDAFAGLFLQSGSFFRPAYDRHESRFSRYLRIVRFVGRVHRARTGPPVDAGLPVTLTCGLAEENRHNNRDMARALRQQGYRVELAEVPDAHNYTAWRDALHPHLTDLLRRVWG